MVRKDITDYISQERIDIFLSMYQTLKSIEMKALPDFPDTEFSKIFSILKNLQCRGWLQKKDVSDINRLIRIRTFRTSKSCKALLKADLSDIMRGVSSKQRGREHENLPLLFLIFALVSHVMKEGKIRNNQACNIVYSFLCDSKEISISLTSDDAFRKAYGRINKNKSKLKHLYEYLRERSKSVECITTEKKPFLQTLYIPTWESLSLPDTDPELVEKWEEENKENSALCSHSKKLPITDNELITAILKKTS